MKGHTPTVKPKEKAHTTTWRGGSTRPAGMANYRGSSPRAHNPVKRGR